VPDLPFTRFHVQDFLSDEGGPAELHHSPKPPSRSGLPASGHDSTSLHTYFFLLFSLRTAFHVKGVIITSPQRESNGQGSGGQPDAESEELEIFFDAEDSAVAPARFDFKSFKKVNGNTSPLKMPADNSGFQIRGAKEQLVALNHLLKTIDASTRRCEDAILKIGEGSTKHSILLRKVTRAVSLTFLIFTLAFGFRFRASLTSFFSQFFSLVSRKFFVK